MTARWLLPATLLLVLLTPSATSVAVHDLDSRLSDSQHEAMLSRMQTLIEMERAERLSQDSQSIAERHGLRADIDTLKSHEWAMMFFVITAGIPGLIAAAFSFMIHRTLKNGKEKKG